MEKGQKKGKERESYRGNGEKNPKKKKMGEVYERREMKHKNCE